MLPLDCLFYIWESFTDFLTDTYIVDYALWDILASGVLLTFLFKIFHKTTT